MEARQGKFVVHGLVEGAIEPIRNPVTGEPHRAGHPLPGGSGVPRGRVCLRARHDPGRANRAHLCIAPRPHRPARLVQRRRRASLLRPHARARRAARDGAQAYRLVVVGALALVTLLAWGWVLAGAGMEMREGAMPGMAPCRGTAATSR